MSYLPAALATPNVTKTLPLAGQSIIILRGITLDIMPAEFVAISGPSGSGKSTLLGIIAGLDAPTQGQVLVDGIDITHMSETRLAGLLNARIGMVFQSFNLIPTLSSQENVEVPLYVGRRYRHPAQRAQEMLRLVGLEQQYRHRPAQLSGGEQQRVAIARALVLQPSIVVMDEPTGNLDRANGEKLLALISQLREATKVTFVVATHDVAIAAADRSVAIIDGQVA